MILVVGATGVLGTDICRRLRARKQQVRGLVRSGSNGMSALSDIGVEVSQGDLRSRESVEAACSGVRTIISTATAMGSTDKSQNLRAVDHDGQLRLVEVAKASGVEQFIYTSVSPVLRESAPLVRYKRAMERAVISSGMRWTILQPAIRLHGNLAQRQDRLKLPHREGHHLWSRDGSDQLHLGGRRRRTRR